MCPCFIDLFAPSIPSSLSTPSLSLPSFCYFRRVSAIESNWVRLYIREDHYPCLPRLGCHWLWGGRWEVRWCSHPGGTASRLTASQTARNTDRQPDRFWARLQTDRVAVTHSGTQSSSAMPNNNNGRAVLHLRPSLYGSMSTARHRNKLIYGANFTLATNDKRGSQFFFPGIGFQQTLHLKIPWFKSYKHWAGFGSHMLNTKAALSI